MDPEQDSSSCHVCRYSQGIEETSVPSGPGRVKAVGESGCASFSLSIPTWGGFLLRARKLGFLCNMSPLDLSPHYFVRPMGLLIVTCVSKACSETGLNQDPATKIWLNLQNSGHPFSSLSSWGELPGPCSSKYSIVPLALWLSMGNAHFCFALCWQELGLVLIWFGLRREEARALIFSSLIFHIP